MSGSSSPRDRIRQVFLYLQALEQLRNPVVRELRKQPWFLRFRDLPNHSDIKIGFGKSAELVGESSEDLESERSADFVLRCRRPDISPPPQPSEVLEDWLDGPLDNPEDPPKRLLTRTVLDDRGETAEVRFDDASERLEAWARFSEEFDAWSEVSKPAARARHVFERLYRLFARLEREGDRLELVVADGLLRWNHKEAGNIDHPLLLQRVHITFDPEIPEFTVLEADHEVELYTSLLRILPDLDGPVVAKLRDQVEQEFLHPLEATRTTKFFRGLIGRLSPRGEFLEQPSSGSSPDNPHVFRDPVLVLRPRSAGFSQAIEAILRSIKEDEARLSSALKRIVGVDDRGAEEVDVYRDSIHQIWSEEDAPDILYSKPANPEQFQIAKKLEQHDSVIVQGPPGTGKSHTIANLIGHLLAQGKSVLVTSHTTKALRVLRGHVDKPLQSLCVSVLDRDTDSKHELESSIQEIVNRLSNSDRGQLENEAEELSGQRNATISELKSLKRDAFEARRSEYEEIVIEDETWTPSEAAKKIAGERAENSWLPGPVERGHPLPLSVSDLTQLYETNRDLPERDEIEMSGELPPLQELLRPSEFRELVEKHVSTEEQLRHASGQDLWREEFSLDQAELLEDIATDLQAVGSIAGDSALPWELEAIQAGCGDETTQEVWHELVTLIERTVNASSKARAERFRWDLVLPADRESKQRLSTCNDILRHIRGGKSLSLWKTWTKPKWKRFTEEVTVNGSAPRRREHFEALAAVLEERFASGELSERWARQMIPLGSSPLEDIPVPLEDYASKIRRCLAWSSAEWEPLREKLRLASFDYSQFIERLPVSGNEHADLERTIEAISSDGPLQQCLVYRLAEVWKSKTQIILNRLQETLESEAEWSSHPLAVDFRTTVSDLDADGYEKAFERAETLQNQRETLETRQRLVDKLARTAPAWAQAVQNREGIHGGDVIPGDPRDAWTWIQLKEELDRRSQIDREGLPRRIEKATERLRETTSKLIETLAWEAQIRRTNLSQQQALVGWSNTMRKIGKGTGKRAPKLRREARHMMKKCRSAVPVWIMPFARVVESFDPDRDRFDVAIIDEASQMDVAGLIVFFLARKVVVVGDHEQVSPLAVGQRVEEVDRLIEEYLDEIPNAHLYDGKTSIYDLARQSFEGLTVLLEHFRCVPPIIEFSNRLCYNGRIRPLRDTSTVLRRPFMVEQRVDHGQAANKINKQEAEFTAALIAAVVEQPEYETATIGVVSLVGENQALEIETRLRRHLEPRILQRHRVLCGNPAQFQGDERDVMFLSMVDSPGDGPLRLREQQLFRQRYNVAVSRARDQFWLVHSLDPTLDLKPKDLRRKLIEHVRSAETPDLEQKLARTESPLEREVMKFLVSRNYRVSPQFPVGAYRIDLVVEDEETRLAVECDGDRYHTIDNLQNDMHRQAVLERLGWRFVRIRGSQFFQDPDRTMKPLIEELDHMGVRPQKTDAKEPESDEQDTESLKDRVLRRAYELKLEWRSKETPEAPLDAPERILASPKGESEDQKRAARVTEAERQYLKRLFRPACSSVVFKPEEWHDLQRYGSYMEALSSGDLKPRTEAQTQFVTVFTEGREPQSKYEKLWWRYLERKKWEADPENRAAMGPLRKLEN